MRKNLPNGGKCHPVMGWYPGHPVAPLIVVNEAADRGRVVYFAAEFDRVTYKSGLPGTLNTLAEAAAAPAPVEVETSPTVEAATHFSPGCNAYTILMLNKTTNDLRTGMVVRHVEPVMDSRITLRELRGGVRSVRSVTGRELEWEQNDDICVVRVPRLEEYEALIVELESL